MSASRVAMEGVGLRSVLDALWRRPSGRLGLAWVGLMLLAALLADCIASDKPLAARIDGELFLLPAVTDPQPLRHQSVASLRAALEEGDWLVPPPIPWGPNSQDKGYAPLEPPSRRHWLGTDTARRDVLARLVHGSRVALLVGVVAVSLYVVLGTLLGLAAGYFGGFVDAAISRLVEVLMSVPVFFLVLAVLGVVERAGIGTLMVVIGLVYWTRIARLVRAETLRLRHADFVVAAELLGYSTGRILLRHILPNAAGPVLVATTFGMAGTILTEAALSFLGFGTPDSMASWGGLLRGAMGNFAAWWLVLFPGLAIFLAVSAYSLIGDALRDILDPRESRVPDGR